MDVMVEKLIQKKENSIESGQCQKAASDNPAGTWPSGVCMCVSQVVR